MKEEKKRKRKWKDLNLDNSYGGGVSERACPWLSFARGENGKKKKRRRKHVDSLREEEEQVGKKTKPFQNMTTIGQNHTKKLIVIG